MPQTYYEPLFSKAVRFMYGISRIKQHGQRAGPFSLMWFCFYKQRGMQPILSGQCKLWNEKHTGVHCNPPTLCCLIITKPYRFQTLTISKLHLLPLLLLYMQTLTDTVVTVLIK